MQKRSVYFLVVAILVVAVFGYFYSFEKVSFSPTSSESNHKENIFPYSQIDQETSLSLVSQNTIEGDGYIVTAKSEPLAKVYAKNKVKSNLKAIVNEQEGRIRLEQDTLENKIISLSRNIKILGRASKVSNSILVSDLTPREIIALGKEGYKVTPNYKVQATLADSIPLINAEDVWKLNANGNRCDITSAPTGTTLSKKPVASTTAMAVSEFNEDCLTGKDVTIGIIDTGVDYTHSDLGGSIIDEKREYIRITNQPIIPYFPITPWDWDQQMRVNDNRVIYYSGDKIYIYYFDTNTTLEIDTPENIYEIVRVAVDKNIIAYFASTANLETSLYYYDLNTSTNTQAIPNYGNLDVGYLAVENGKIIYSMGFPQEDELISKIYVYDITTQEITPIAEDQQFILMPVVSGNKIAYSVSLPYGTCYEKMKVYDMNTGEETELVPPNIGPILDFEGDNVLYVDCSKTDFDSRWRHYHLYDTITGESTALFYSNEESDQLDTINSLNSRGVHGWISKGSIGDNVVFFSKNSNANIIIAYDLNLERYVEINPYKVSGNIDSEGKKVCFISNDLQIYCHDHDPNYDYPKPDVIFNGKVIGGYDFVNQDTDPMDDHGHGTHCAAIAAGNGALKGVAPEAQIVAYKVLDSGGSGNWFNIISAIERGVDPNQDGDFSDHLDVISLSLGGSGNPDDEISLAIDNAVDAGVIAVIAAGNSGPDLQTISSPGTSRKAITVGASDKTDSLAIFSSRGPVIWENIEGKKEVLIKPDLVAPGVDICAAQWGSAWYWLECLDNDHVAISGTSMATPHVAGLAALLKQKNPGWTPQEIKDTLKESSVDLGLTTKEQGHGRIDALGAISFANPPTETWDFGLIPPEGPMHNIEENLEIKGVFPESYDSLIIKYANKLNPGIWLTTGLTVVGSENMVAIFDSSSIKETGTYIFRVVITKNGKEMEDTTEVYFNTDLPKSWKQVGSEILSPLNIADIDNDGENELIAYSKDGYVHVWNSDGSYVPGWPAFTAIPNSYCLNLIHQRSSSPTVGDLDGDGKKEIILGALDGSLYVFENDGTLKEGWPQRELTNCFATTPALTDLNEDGLSDIAIIGYELYAFDYRGNLLQGFPVFRVGFGGPDFSSSPSVEDIDKDGTDEILSGTDVWWENYGNMEAINADGTDVVGWPFETGDLIYSTPAIGDVDNDGTEEIAFCNRDQNLYLVSGTGAIKPGWPQNIDCIDGDPALADITGDGNLEIIAGGMKFYGGLYYLHVKDSSGADLPGWPISIEQEVGGSFGKGMIGPIVGDIDSDNDLEIIALPEYPDFVAGGSYIPEVYAWNEDASIVEGWPKPVYPTKSSPILADFDGNGKNELILASDNKIYVINTPGTASQSNSPWTMFKHDPQHTGCYDCTSTTPSNETSCPQGWQYLPSINKCFFNGNTMNLNFTDAVSYCQNQDGWLPSSSELNASCNEIDLRPNTESRGSVRVNDVYQSGHKTWHDKGYHFTNDLCGEVSYDFCGTQGMNANCQWVEGWVSDDRTDKGFVCIAEPGVQSSEEPEVLPAEETKTIETAETVENAEAVAEETKDASLESIEKERAQEAEPLLSPTENLWNGIKEFFIRLF